MIVPGRYSVGAACGLPRDWFDEVVVASQSWREIASTLAQLGVERTRISLYRPGDGLVVPAFEAAMPATMRRKMLQFTAP